MRSLLLFLLLLFLDLVAVVVVKVAAQQCEIRSKPPLSIGTFDGERESEKRVEFDISLLSFVVIAYASISSCGTH